MLKKRLKIFEKFQQQLNRYEIGKRSFLKYEAQFEVFKIFHKR